ncbi:hypothetical protein [Hymenobacter terrestris]|uniref:Uncharacterized protein n=1 Tax=Hymenobacter terrestris TaxID=2748310 RepID=A0ABX2Q5V1_9BACT|nr:hypothetical protein [Hymenobacter terrestris]NVO86343.1 hypothetical protein [Hymenobacter terrestris]
MSPKFKVCCPGGYQVEDVFNHNLDLNIVLDTEEVFFATVFTIRNVQALLTRSPEPYFWSVDMFIVDNLRVSTILDAVASIVQQGMADTIFGRIGTTATVYEGSGHSFANLPGYLQ